MDYLGMVVGPGSLAAPGWAASSALSYVAGGAARMVGSNLTGAWQNGGARMNWRRRAY